MTQHKPSQTNSKKQRSRGRKHPKKISATYLHNAGLFYLERYASSSANFRAVMLRKVKRSCMAHEEQDYKQCTEMVDKLVDKFIKVGLLDDNTYMRSMVLSLRRRGKSTRAIQNTLRAKGLEIEQIDAMINEIDHQDHQNQADAELHAARTYARKKRLGPWRNEKEFNFQKELSRMARAGFSYDTSRYVLESDEKSY